MADGRPDLDLVPTRGQPGATDAQQTLTELVERSVRTVAARRLRNGTLSFDDVLIQLRDALCGPGPGAVGAVESLRGRFKVALIDEFQDTDAVQWDILSTLFDQPGSGTRLVLVGDPKQAIYGFRGADIHTYLRAVGDGSLHRPQVADHQLAIGRGGAVTRSPPCSTEPPSATPASRSSR